jgi:hypothetical protein
VHVIDHPDARVLVDTGMTERHPAVADLDPRLRPLSKQDFDLAGIDIVVNHTPALRSLSWSGSRTSTSRGDPTPSKASRRRSLGLPRPAPDAVSETLVKVLS